MRTTLDIDDDVLDTTREMARRRGVSLGQVLSDLARQALTGSAGTATRNGLPLFPIATGAAEVTPDLIKRLRDDAP